MSYISLDSASVSSWVQPSRDGALKNNSRFATKTKDEQKKAASKDTTTSSSSADCSEQNTLTTHGIAEAKENSSQLSSMRTNMKTINAREKGHHCCRIVRQCPNCQMLYASSFHSCGPSSSSALSIRK